MSINMNTVTHKHEMIDNFRILWIQKTFCKSVRFYQAVLAFQRVTSPHIVEEFCLAYYSNLP